MDTARAAFRAGRTRSPPARIFAIRRIAALHELGTADMLQDGSGRWLWARSPRFAPAPRLDSRLGRGAHPWRRGVAGAPGPPTGASAANAPGVCPLSLFYDRQKKSLFSMRGVARAVADKIATRGTNLWYDATPAQILEGVKLPADWPAGSRTHLRSRHP